MSDNLKVAEIAKLKEENDSWQKATAETENKLIASCDQIQGYLQQLSTANERIAYLEVLVALQAEEIESLVDDWDDLLEDLEMHGMHQFEPYIRSKAKMKLHGPAISASAETVQAFRDKLTAEAEARGAVKALEEAALKWLPNMRRSDFESSMGKSVHNMAVDDCVKHVLSMAESIRATSKKAG